MDEREEPWPKVKAPELKQTMGELADAYGRSADSVADLQQSLMVIRNRMADIERQLSEAVAEEKKNWTALSAARDAERGQQ